MRGSVYPRPYVHNDHTPASRPAAASPADVYAVDHEAAGRVPGSGTRRWARRGRLTASVVSVAIIVPFLIAGARKRCCHRAGT